MPSYTVRAGDTLSGIATRNGTTLSALLSANPGITNPNLIFPGQVIQLPYGGRNDTERYEAIERPPFISGTQTGSTTQAPTNTGKIFNDVINWGLNDFLQGGGGGSPAPTANFTGGGSGGTTSGGGSTSTGGAGGGGTVTAEQAAKLGPGVVKFAVQTAAGIEERFVYFPPHVWQEIMASPMKDRWGLDQTFFESGFPEIPVARIEDFRGDINNFLSPTSRIEAMNVMQTVDYNAFNPKNIPPPPGFAWSTDPNTGERIPVDLQPLVGPPITSWHWNAETAQWVQVNDPTDIATSMFEGIPEAVRPWLQLALDNGGDASVVTDPVARRWVEYALDQHGESSMRPPVESPFGTGVPNFGPGGVGSSINPPPFAVGGNLVVPPGTTAPGTTTPTNFAGSPLRPIITAAEIFGNRPVGADFAGVDEWQSSLDALMHGGSVGTSKDIFNQNNAAGEFYRSLRDKGLIDIIDQGQQLSPQEQAAHNAQRQAQGLPPINFNDNITIVWREGPSGSAWKPGYDPRYGVIPTPPSGQPGDMGGYMPGTVPNQPAPAPNVSAPVPPAATPQSAPPPAPTQLQQAYNAGQLPAGSAGARAYENLYGAPSAPPPAPWEQVYKDLVSKGYQLPGYAWGGITSEKMFRVGEDGPEIIYNPSERPVEVIPEKRIGKGGADPKGLKAQRFVMNEDDKSNRRPKTTIPAGGGMRFDKDRPLDTSQVVDSRPDPLESILQDRLAQYTRDTGRIPTPFQIAEQRRIVQAEFANRETEMDRAFANQSVLGIPHAAPAAAIVGGIMGEIDRFTGAPIRGAIKTPQNPLGGAFAGFMNPDYASGRDILGIDRLSDKDIIGSFSPRDIAGFGAEVVSDVGTAGGLLRKGSEQALETGLRAAIVPLPEGFMNKISQAGWKEIPLERTRGWETSAWLSPKGEILSKRGAIHADINVDGGLWDEASYFNNMYGHNLTDEMADYNQYKPLLDAGWVRIMGPSEFAVGHPSGFRQIENLLLEKKPAFPTKDYTVFIARGDGSYNMARFNYEEFMQNGFRLRDTIQQALRQQTGGGLRSNLPFMSSEPPKYTQQQVEFLMRMSEEARANFIQTRGLPPLEPGSVAPAVPTSIRDLEVELGQWEELLQGRLANPDSVTGHSLGEIENNLKMIQSELLRAYRRENRPIPPYLRRFQEWSDLQQTGREFVIQNEMRMGQMDELTEVLEDMVRTERLYNMSHQEIMDSYGPTLREVTKDMDISPEDIESMLNEIRLGSQESAPLTQFLGAHGLSGYEANQVVEDIQSLIDSTGGNSNAIKAGILFHHGVDGKLGDMTPMDLDEFIKHAMDVLRD